jgi:hypothetical protein
LAKNDEKERYERITGFSSVQFNSLIFLLFYPLLSRNILLRNRLGQAGSLGVRGSPSAPPKFSKELADNR